MRWFIQGKEGARLPWKEWDKAAADPEDMLASMALGEKAYRVCMRAAKLPPQKEDKNTITAFAHILHHMLDEIDEERFLELRYVLQEGWREGAPWLWEPPNEVLWPIGEDLRTELLSLRHVLERAIAPGIFGVFWAAMTAAGRRIPVRSTEFGTGLSYSLAMLDRMRADDIPPFLDDEEREGMDLLRSLLRLSDWTPIDELAGCLSGQRYIVHQGRIFIEGTTSGGKWADRKEVLDWRRKALRSCSLLLAFRVMFLASVTGESGPLRVSYPD
jgi:hypothetical protein